MSDEAALRHMLADAMQRVVDELRAETSPAPPKRPARARRTMLKAPEKRPSDTTLKRAARIIERHGGKVV